MFTHAPFKLKSYLFWVWKLKSHLAYSRVLYFCGTYVRFVCILLLLRPGFVSFVSIITCIYIYVFILKIREKCWKKWIHQETRLGLWNHACILILLLWPWLWLWLCYEDWRPYPCPIPSPLSISDMTTCSTPSYLASSSDRSIRKSTVTNQNRKQVNSLLITQLIGIIN